MLKIINTIINRLTNGPKISSKRDGLNFLYQIPFKLPQKRWPHFWFKSHNSQVEAAQAIFKDFQHTEFFSICKRLTAFQHHSGYFEARDILAWVQIETKAINQLRASFETFQSSFRTKKLHSFLMDVNSYIQSLENTLFDHRQHYKTALYLHEGIRHLLQDTEMVLNKLFNFLDDASILEIPKRLGSCREKLDIVKSELKHFPEYHDWNVKLSSTLTFLENIVGGNTQLSYEDLKKKIQPWFSDDASSEVFLEKCIRQLFTHFMLPHIKLLSNNGLSLIRQFHSIWAESISHQLKRTIVVAHPATLKSKTYPSSQHDVILKQTDKNHAGFWSKPIREEKHSFTQAQSRSVNEDYKISTTSLH